MDTETGNRPDPTAATALQREIEAAIKRIEMGLAQASAGIATLQKPLLVMTNLLLVTRGHETAVEGQPATTDQPATNDQPATKDQPAAAEQAPEAAQSVPEDQGPFGKKGTVDGDLPRPPSKIEERLRELEERERQAAGQSDRMKEDVLPSGVELDPEAKERLSKIEERLRSLDG